MNLLKNIEQYNQDFVYFSEPTKNNIMNNGHFIRIIYSSSFFMLNGIYLYSIINYKSVEKYFNKCKCSFDVNQNKELIENIRNIEVGLLNKIGIKNKSPQYKVSEQLSNGNIKILTDRLENIQHLFILKISGIWETDNEYGLTYKFII